MKRKIALVLTALLVLVLIFGYMAKQPVEDADVHAQTYQFLTEKGFSPVQASGIMAAIKMNSNFDPTATAPNDFGYGLLQWVGHRRDRLEKFADEIGKPIDDSETQLLFLMEEIDSESEYYIYLSSYAGYEWTDFLETTTPREAAECFYMVYSMPMPYNVNLDLVGEWAEEFYEQYATN